LKKKTKKKEKKEKNHCGLLWITVVIHSDLGVAEQ
jgi:hypothetical protein